MFCIIICTTVFKKLGLGLGFIKWKTQMKSLGEPGLSSFNKKVPGSSVVIFVVFQISGASSNFLPALSRSAVVHQPAAGAAEPAHTADLWTQRGQFLNFVIIMLKKSTICNKLLLLMLVDSCKTLWLRPVWASTVFMYKTVQFVKNYFSSQWSTHARTTSYYDWDLFKYRLFYYVQKKYNL